MSQPKLNLPSTPTYYQNPLQSGDLSTLSGLGHQLTSGDLNSGAGGDLSWLQSTINPNNSANALSAAQGILQPQFRDTLQQINNNAAANNQLNSSTYTDALARSQSDLNSQYQSIVSQQAINDANQANANKLSLFGTGLNTLSGALGAEQQDTGSQNQFNLENYSNQVAQSLNNYQQQANGNVFGNILSSFSPAAHDVYSGLGYNVPGMGVEQTALTAASFMGGGGGLGGNGGGLGGGNRVQPYYAPGSTASNNPWMNSLPYSPNNPFNLGRY